MQGLLCVLEGPQKISAHVPEQGVPPQDFDRSRMPSHERHQGEPGLLGREAVDRGVRPDHPCDVEALPLNSQSAGTHPLQETS